MEAEDLAQRFRELHERPEVHPQQATIDLNERFVRRCEGCGHQAIERGEITMWGMCRSCENARLSA